MSGFLDRLAARAVGEAPLMQPRLRSRFEPDAGVLPGGPVEPAQEFEEVVEAAEKRVSGVPEGSRAESSPPGPLSRGERGSKTSPSGPQTPASPDLPLSSRERGPGGEDSARPTFEPSQSLGQVPEALETEEVRPRRDPRLLTSSPVRAHARPEERGEPRPAPLSLREVAPPLPGDGRADGRGERRVRVHETSQPAELHQATELSAPPPVFPAERRRLASASPESAVEPQSPRLRPRSALAGDLPTVEPDRRAPLPPSPEESEPSETVVHVSIGRIDVRAVQPPAPERRPARPAGPRLSLTDYLKRREGRR